VGFNADLADMAASIDEELGEPATWSGVPGEVRVHDDQADGDVAFGRTDVVLSRRVILVHRDQVAQPKEGDVVMLLESGATLNVRGDPTVDRDGYWTCTVQG